MHQLSPFTCRRLSQLPRLTSVWECDRRPLSALTHPTSADSRVGAWESLEGTQGDCIIWVDSLQGTIRGLSVVPPETGHEAIVRTLLQAIEAPQGGLEPARPRKVVVCDREIQFFLRGALQDLDIPVEYSPSLPFIDEVFQKLQAPEQPPVTLPDGLQALLIEKAALLWQDAPWHYLSEQEILAIELNRWDIDTLYLSVLGLAGLEYGLLFYRDLASLQQFRHKLLNNDDFSDDMQQAFLEQNCLFINFNPVEDVIALSAKRMARNASDAFDKTKPKPTSADQAVEYEFGSLHPLEGLRSQLEEEEAASLIVVLEALHRFFKKQDLSQDDFALTSVTSRFRIDNPFKALERQSAASPEAEAAAPEAAALNATAASEPTSPPRRSKPSSPAERKRAETITVRVSTVPEISAAFLEETLSAAEGEDPEDLCDLIDDSVPEGALIMMGKYSDESLGPLRANSRIHYQSFLSPPSPYPTRKAEWPILTIQTSRPKAQKLLDCLLQEGGLESICFNPGSDPANGRLFQVGLLQTAVGNLHLFNEYALDTPADRLSLEKWEKGLAKNHLCCGCILAAGATGARRGRPSLKEIIAFFEITAKTPEELGLSPLVMSYVVQL